MKKDLMKKITFVLFVAASLPLVAQQSKSLSHTTFQQSLDNLKRLLRADEGSHERNNITDVELAGYFGELQKKLLHAKTSISQTEGMRIARTHARFQAELSRAFSTLIGTLSQKTVDLYTQSQENHPQEDMLGDLTKLNSLYNALYGALEGTKLQDQLEPTKQKLAVIRATLVDYAPMPVQEEIHTVSPRLQLSFLESMITRSLEEIRDVYQPIEMVERLSTYQQEIEELKKSFSRTDDLITLRKIEKLQQQLTTMFGIVIKNLNETIEHAERPLTLQEVTEFTHRYNALARALARSTHHANALDTLNVRLNEMRNQMGAE